LVTFPKSPGTSISFRNCLQKKGGCHNLVIVYLLHGGTHRQNSVFPRISGWFLILN
jgi:hypothetical protein